VRKGGEVNYLRPDGKTQVSVRYRDGRPVEIEKLLISTQHKEGASRSSRTTLEHVVEPVLPKDLYDATKLRRNFLVNRPAASSSAAAVANAGLTGRKIIVETYGGMAPRRRRVSAARTPSKVDRSGAYAARTVAKNVVAAGLADRCEVRSLRHRRGAPVQRDGRRRRHPRRSSGAHRRARRRALRPASARSARSSSCTGRSTRRPPRTARPRTLTGNGEVLVSASLSLAPRLTARRPSGAGRYPWITSASAEIGSDVNVLPSGRTRRFFW